MYDAIQLKQPTLNENINAFSIQDFKEIFILSYRIMQRRFSSENNGSL